MNCKDNSIDRFDAFHILPLFMYYFTIFMQKKDLQAVMKLISPHVRSNLPSLTNGVSTLYLLQQ